MGKVEGGTAPIIVEGVTSYSNPLPHVLILTAIVVGVATLAVGLALIVRINEAYSSIEDDEIRAKKPTVILAHLPALQVVLPLCAPFCLLFRWSGLTASHSSLHGSRLPSPSSC